MQIYSFANPCRKHFSHFHFLYFQFPFFSSDIQFPFMFPVPFSMFLVQFFMFLFLLCFQFHFDVSSFPIMFSVPILMLLVPLLVFIYSSYFCLLCLTAQYDVYDFTLLICFDLVSFIMFPLCKQTTTKKIKTLKISVYSLFFLPPIITDGVIISK